MEGAQNGHPLRKRRRVELACTACRQKKSRCDGQRPGCSSCVELGIQCKYENTATTHNTKQPTKNHSDIGLVQKVKELEDKLSSLSSAGPGLQPNTRIIAHGDEFSPPTAFSDDRPEVIPTIESNSNLPGDSLDNIPGESAVDTLATNAFDESPETDIGYFGPTSNHALFRCLSVVFARSKSFASANGDPDMRNKSKSGDRHRASESVKTQKQRETATDTVDLFSLPDGHDLFSTVTSFCDTVGMALPFVSREFLLLECSRFQQMNHRQHSRCKRALLNIVCALSPHTHPSRSHEIFYRRALGLLDERTLRGSNIELIQTLLLIATFQQNNQRAVASWTYHAVAVKAAYQLGLHSRLANEDLSPPDSALRQRLWHAVVNQDSCLSIALGRPCLIPMEHVRVRKVTITSSEHPHTPTERCGLQYFDQILSLCSIKSCVIRDLYGHNIEPLQTLQETIIRTLDLSFKLDEWEKTTRSTFRVLSGSDLEGWDANMYRTHRFTVLLSVEYYRAKLLIGGSVLTQYIDQTFKQQGPRKPSATLLEHVVPVIKRDFSAAKELQQIIHSVSTHGEDFLEFNACWWTCNYSALTVILHLFGILLACQCDEVKTSLRDSGVSEVRSLLDCGLETLGAVERTSLMSRKAGQCMRRFLEVYDALANEKAHGVTDPSERELSRRSLAPTGVDFPTEDCFSEDFISQLITQSADDFLFQCSDSAFMDADIGFM